MKIKEVILFFIILVLFSAGGFSFKVDKDIVNEINKNGKADVIVVFNDFNINNFNLNNFTKVREKNLEKIKVKVKARQEEFLKRLKYKSFKQFKSFGINNFDDFVVKHRYALINAVSGKLTKKGYEKILADPLLKSLIKEIKLDKKIFKISLQDTVNLTDAIKVWERTINNTNITGKGITACVVDTGIYYLHADLGGCLGNNCKVVSGYDFINNDADPLDDNGHGTHVAGIIAANGSIKGIAPEARLVALKALDALGQGTEADIAAAIDWCVANATKFNISLISMSIGTSTYHNDIYCDADFSLLSSAIDNAYANNIFVVVSTGNEGNYTGISAPACINKTLRVAAIDKNNAYASFANRARSFPDIFALYGVNINSTYNDGSYTILSGTSQAAPHLSGLIALLLSDLKLKNISYDVDNIKKLLLDTAIKLYDSATDSSFSKPDIVVALHNISDGLIINRTGNYIMNEFAKIKFYTSVDFPAKQCINLSYNHAEITPDTSNCEELNKSAIIDLYGLNLTNPVILKDGKICDDCNIINNTKSILRFNVTSFSIYSARERNANLSLIYNARVKPGEMIYIYANYTNASSGEVISNANCSFFLFNESYNMSFNSSVLLYFINISFNSSGLYDFNISCNVFDFDKVISNGTIKVKYYSNCSLNFSLPSPQVYGTLINASCKCLNNETIPTLLRNGVNVTNENGKEVLLDAGIYNYTCYVNETLNYVGESINASFEIIKANVSLNLTGNWNISYGDYTNISCSFINTSNLINISNDSIALYRNNISVNNPDISLLLPGIYNYTCVFNGTNNYNARNISRALNVLCARRNISASFVDLESLYVNGSNILLRINASVYNLSVNASILMPNNSIKNLSLNFNESSGFYQAVFNDTLQEGSYVVIANISDRCNNTALINESFDVYRQINFTFKLLKSFMNYSFVFKYGNNTIVSNETNNETLILMPETIYNVSIKYGDVAVSFDNFNVSLNNNKSFGIDNSTIYGLITYGFYSEFAGINNITIEINYSKLNYSNESKLLIYRCNNYNFTNKSCSSSWLFYNNISQDKARELFYIYASGFSAYAVYENITTGSSEGNTGGSQDTEGGSGGGGGGSSSACIPSWYCYPFGECINGLRRRSCIDLNNCNTLEGMPALVMPCEENKTIKRNLTKEEKKEEDKEEKFVVEAKSEEKNKTFVEEKPKARKNNLKDILIFIGISLAVMVFIVGYIFINVIDNKKVREILELKKNIERSITRNEINNAMKEYEMLREKFSKIRKRHRKKLYKEILKIYNEIKNKL